MAGIYGSIPQIPLPTQTQPGVISGNVKQLPAIMGLGTAATDWQQGQLLKDLGGAIPGYSNLVQQSSANIGNELAGKVPDDVLNEILQGAAERGIMTGSPGSPNADTAYLRALGLTSLDMTKLGEANLTGAIARTPQAKPFDLTSMFVTPEQQQAAAAANAIYAAAPDPTLAGQHAEQLYSQRNQAAGAFAPSWSGGGGAGGIPWNQGPAFSDPGDANNAFNASLAANWGVNLPAPMLPVTAAEPSPTIFGPTTDYGGMWNPNVPNPQDPSAAYYDPNQEAPGGGSYFDPSIGDPSYDPSQDYYY